jgi:hypothetical protein
MATVKKPLSNESIGILCSELYLQLNYIKKDGNKYHAIDHARQLVKRLNLSIPKELRLR